MSKLMCPADVPPLIDPCPAWCATPNHDADFDRVSGERYQQHHAEPAVMSYTDPDEPHRECLRQTVEVRLDRRDEPGRPGKPAITLDEVNPNLYMGVGDAEELAGLLLATAARARQAERVRSARSVRGTGLARTPLPVRKGPDGDWCPEWCVEHPGSSCAQHRARFGTTALADEEMRGVDAVVDLTELDGIPMVEIGPGAGTLWYRLTLAESEEIHEALGRAINAARASEAHRNGSELAGNSVNGLPEGHCTSGSDR